MKLIFKQGVFIWQGAFEEKHHVANSGFTWHRPKGPWYTRDLVIANCFRSVAEGEALTRLEHLDEAVKSSRRAEADIDIPRPGGLEYYPFQRAGVSFLIERFKEID